MCVSLPRPTVTSRQYIRHGLFREDLFYRLNVVTIRTPPLRERVEDIPALTHHFLARAQAEGLPLKALDAGAIPRLKRYSWPGNVRELENLTRRLSAIYSEDVITADMIDTELNTPNDSVPAADHVPQTLAKAAEAYVDSYFEHAAAGEEAGDIYAEVMRDVGRPLIRHALTVTRGNQIKAASLLGLNRNTLRKKMRELEITHVRAVD